MGLGDDIMATAYAKIEKEKFPDRQVVVGNFKKKIVFESIIYNNNPYITQRVDLDESKPIHFIDNYPENRPYIDWKKTPKITANYFWNLDYKVTPGQIFLSLNENQEANKILDLAKNYWFKKNSKQYKKIIFIEPSSTKVNENQFIYKHKNKDWGVNNWEKLSSFLGDEYLIIQSVHELQDALPNVFSCCVSFRIACALINIVDLYIGPEGGLGHAAAALSKPAIIIFGGWVYPSVTGYDIHENIYVDIEHSPCGALSFECDHCKKCMKEISINLVTNLLKKLI